jgi:hypothetical protein
MNTDAQPQRTGALQYVGVRHHGRDSYAYWRCVDCGTDYPGSCNGHRVGLCPFCRPDTKAWKDGRGL